MVWAFFGKAWSTDPEALEGGGGEVENLGELEGKGKPRKNFRGLHAGPLIGTPTDSKGFGCPEALREGSGS